MDLPTRIAQRPNALTVEELADLLNNSVKTLYKAVKKGRLPAYRLGGSIRFDPFDVAQWLRQRRTK